MWRCGDVEMWSCRDVDGYVEMWMLRCVDAEM